MIYLFEDMSNIGEDFIEMALKHLPGERCQRGIRYWQKIDRNLYVISYLLLCFGLKDQNVRYEGKLMFNYNENGKPYLQGIDDIFFNISHCSIGAVCAISNIEVGVDIQDILPFNADVAQRVCSDSELSMIDSCRDQDRMFCKLWTLKESYIKAIGTGLSTPLKEVSFGFDGKAIISNKPNWQFSLFDGEGYFISACSREALNKYQRISVADLKMMLELQA
jgi:4'-phosphopantetheinyl transferase